MKKVSNNVIKVIAISTVTMLIALTLELLMYHQHGTSLVSSTVLWRAGLIVALSVVVDFLAALDWRFDGYVTVLVMLYYAAADWRLVTPGSEHVNVLRRECAGLVA